MLFKGAEKIWRLTIRTLSSWFGSLHFVCRSFLHTSEPSKRESQLQLPSLRALILRERAPSLGPERPRVSTWAAGVCLTCLWFEPPQLRHLASTLEMLTFGSAPPWSPGEKKNPLWLPKLCVCVCKHVPVCVCVCLMMMMNGGLPLHALPMSTACKHREMIWADTLSCSLMQLYIQSTKWQREEGGGRRR